MSEATKDARHSNARVDRAVGSLLTYMCPDCHTLVPFYHAERLWREPEGDDDQTPSRAPAEEAEGDELAAERVPIEQIDPPL